MKHKTSKILNRILALIIAAGICLPIVFTAWQMDFYQGTQSGGADAGGRGRTCSAYCNGL